MSAEVIPNPAHDIASIEFSGATGTIAIQITDELGNVIATANVNNNVYALNAAGLASGIYFYSAHDANGNKASGKISVVH
jgi:NADPH:quinone reductase-like Zn-dependent oxidoreductase